MNFFTEKFLSCILICTLILSLAGCQAKENSTENSVSNDTPTQNSATESSPSTDKSLYQHGMDIVALMDEMLRSEIYLSTMTGSSEIQAKAEEIARGNYSSPKTVYEITPPTFNKLLALLEEEIAGMDQLSPALQENLNNRSTSAFLTQLNAMNGTTSLATVSVFTGSKTFVSGMLTENLIYLYTFEEGYPIAVTFTKGEGGAVAASGLFLLSDKVSVESIEALEQSLADMYMECTISEVEMK
ncbi:MAG: hypothetical protein IJ379_13645 [Lachnospiraceae bacterium]|nr:hypothetical protein [Lachnospiraceae bacterium]